MINITNLKLTKKSQKIEILNKFGSIIEDNSNENIIFGQLEQNIYTLSLKNIKVRDCVAFAKELNHTIVSAFEESNFDIELDFGITNSDHNDTFETIVEKLIDALGDEDKYKVEL
jgi:hypothetical protein